jgi:hypothetical protein
MNRAENLLEAFDDLTWENYVEITQSIALVNMDNIDEELVRQSSTYAYYSGLLAVAKKKMDEANLTLTTFSAQTRKEKKSSTIAKQTAKDLDDFVEASDDFRVYTQKAIDVSSKYNLLKSLVSALNHKKDMLVQLSSNRRAETNLYSR